MLGAVPNLSANIFATHEIWSLGGMINDIMLVLLRTYPRRPYFEICCTQMFLLSHVLSWTFPAVDPQATSKLLMSFLIIQIFMFLLAALRLPTVFSPPPLLGSSPGWQWLPLLVVEWLLGCRSPVPSFQVDARVAICSHGACQDSLLLQKDVFR